MSYNFIIYVSRCCIIFIYERRKDNFDFEEENFEENFEEKTELSMIANALFILKSFSFDEFGLMFSFSEFFFSLYRCFFSMNVLLLV